MLCKVAGVLRATERQNSSCEPAIARLPFSTLVVGQNPLIRSQTLNLKPMNPKPLPKPLQHASCLKHGSQTAEALSLNPTGYGLNLDPVRLMQGRWLREFVAACQAAGIEHEAGVRHGRFRVQRSRVRSRA